MGSYVYHFNSRLYMRGNLRNQNETKWITNFNSRLYMRGNNAAVVVWVFIIISIHAST